MSLNVTFNLTPLGYEEGKEQLGSIEIWNDGTGTETRSHYDYILRGKKGKVMKRGRISNYARKQLNAWELVRRVLNQWRGE